jgi:hypothetical protein
MSALRQIQTIQTSIDLNNHPVWAACLTLALCLCLALPNAAFAQSNAKASDPSWSVCEHATVSTEMAQRLPRAVLFSVSMVESGRFNKETRKTRPWPWTINAEGQSYYFDSKSDAVAAARHLLKEGIRSIDVGCMQINLRYHPNAFRNLETAFDPATNVAYSAEFLKTLYTRTKSWPDAIAAYHSQSKTRSRPYFARVINVWTNQHARIAKLAHVLKEQTKAQVTAQLRQGQEEDSSIVTNVRPAPKVLATEDVSNVREVAGGSIGLRLSIADNEFATANAGPYRPAPHVLPDDNQSVASIKTKPTILADASPGA